MPNGSKHSSLSDDDDDVPDHDEDDTAKLSNERRSGKGKAADYNASSSTLERVKSLTERNRKVLYFLRCLRSIAYYCAVYPPRSLYFNYPVISFLYTCRHGDVISSMRIYLYQPNLELNVIFHLAGRM